MSNIRNIVIRSILAIVLIACILVPFMAPAPVQAVVHDRYWIGGTGNWSDTAHWATSSGNVTGGSSLPTSEANVHFDANSFTAPGQVVTISATANCLNMDWTGALNTPTLAFNSNLDAYGNVTFILAMATSRDATSRALSLYGTGKVLTGNGVSLSPVVTIRNNTTLGSDLICAYTLILAAGTFDSSNYNITAYTMTDGGSASAKTLTLGTSIITLTRTDISGGWYFPSSGLTLTDSTHVINIPGSGAFSGGTLVSGSYGTVNLNGTAHTVSGSNTFVNLTRTGTATKTDTLTLTAGTTQTVTGTCALIGNSAVNRLLVQSSTLGTAATLHVTTDVAANWTGTNAVDFMDITSTHAVDFSAAGLNPAGYAGDCGGNTDITCTASDAQTSASTASWATVAGWTGTVISRVPLPQDDVTCSHSKTVDMPRIGRSITFTGTPTITKANGIDIFGSFTMVSGMTYAAVSSTPERFRGRSVGMPVGGWVITPAGKILRQVFIYAPTGTLILNGNMESFGGIYVNDGTLSTSTYNTTCYQLQALGTNTKSILLGSGTHTMNNVDAAYKFDMNSGITGLTFNAGTSTIVLTNAGAVGQLFLGASLTYNNVTVQGGAYALTISGNNTFTGNFTVDRTSANKTLTLTASSNQTMNSFVCDKSDARWLTINSTAGTAYLTKTGGGASGITYLSLANNTGVPASSWYYTPVSVIGVNVNGWVLDAPPSVTTLAPSVIGETTATGRGDVTNLNFGGDINSFGILYDTDTGHPYAFTANTTADMGIGIFTQPLVGLTKGELYYFVSHATNDDGYAEGLESTFLTKPDEPTLFTATSGAVSGRISLVWVKGTGAQNTYIRGNIGSAPTFSGAGGTTVYNNNGTSFNHDGLTGGNVWYYRAYSYATEGGLEQYSDLYDDDDETVVATPTVTTQAVTLAEETTAVLHGTIVNTGGINSSTRGGEYDTNAGFPYAVSATDAGSFTAGVFSKSIAGLLPGTLYYTVAKATTASLTGYGAEVTFLTKPLPATNVVITPSGVNQLTITWTKGTGALRTLVRHKENGYPTSRTDGTQVYFDTGTSTTIVGLMENKTYFVRLWSERTEGGWQQYDDDTQGSQRSSGIADDMMNTIVSLAMALMTVICMFALIGQLGQGSPVGDIIKIVIIAALGMICFVVMKGVIGL
jgi:hypothetical protein